MKSYLLSDSQPEDDRCRTFYMKLSHHCYKKGLDKSEIDKTARERIAIHNDRCYLKTDYYKPTGVALGCPLPDKRITKRLWQFSKLVESYLSRFSRKEKCVFAFVPGDCYHTTILNWTHYAVSDKIVSMKKPDAIKVEQVIHDTIKSPVTLHINGIFLTSTGTLIIPGFPADNSLYTLRSRLLEAIPEFRTRIPFAAHIKLGHLLVHLRKSKLEKFQRWLSSFAYHISGRMVFHDVYTPVKRIFLPG
ncbi:MAG: hypothetical protein JXJ04_02140 [Spirochaetales bacterium]|nr:hypothetical protein [Spirochaetales bacterium]